jgi:hypothetical protein
MLPNVFLKRESVREGIDHSHEGPEANEALAWSKGNRRKAGRGHEVVWADGRDLDVVKRDHFGGAANRVTSQDRPDIDLVAIAQLLQVGGCYPLAGSRELGFDRGIAAESPKE